MQYAVHLRACDSRCGRRAPELDLRVARLFHAVETPDHSGFALRLLLARDFGLWIPALLVAPAVCALVIKLILPWRKLLMPGRAVVFLIATMILAPGIMANVILKEHWGRSRLIEVIQFGGHGRFVPWWDRRGDCPQNCSFVSGDVAGAFWPLAAAALAPPQWRALAYIAALALGTGVAALRMLFGAHFPSDVIFAGVFTYLISRSVVGPCLRIISLRDCSVESQNRVKTSAEREYFAQQTFGSIVRPQNFDAGGLRWPVAEQQRQ